MSVSSRTLELGSLTLISTPGHSAGHQSLLVRCMSGRRVLLLGDAAHLMEQIDDPVPQAYLHDAGQPMPLYRRQAIGLQQGDLAFDQAGIRQPLDAAQARGRGNVHCGRQSLVALGRVGLQEVKQAKISAIECDRFHIFVNF